MKSIANLRRDNRMKRHRRIRKHVGGTAERPRMSVFRSHAHMHVQLVDDARGVSLVGASTLSPELKETIADKPKHEACRELGKLIASRAAAKGIKQVSFDRGGYIYHGRIKAIADGAREGGLDF